MFLDLTTSEPLFPAMGDSENVEQTSIFLSLEYKTFVFSFGCDLLKHFHDRFTKHLPKFNFVITTNADNYIA